MRICVTGGAGYIGSALVRRLQVKGHEVDVIDWAVGKDVFHVREFDYDVVYHLAAISGIKACEKHPIDFVGRINIDACEHVAKNCREDTLLVYTSTSAIYAETQSLYSWSKAGGEQYILGCHEKSICLRLATIYGVSPFMRRNLLIHDLVRSAVQDGYIVVWDEGTVRPYMAIDDCTRLLVSFAKGKHKEHYGGVINAFDNSLIHSKGYIATLIANMTGCELFHSKKQDKYSQNITGYTGFLNYGDAKSMSANTLQPIIDYYGH